MAEQPKKKAGYRDTLNLPVTEFPMKADLASREPDRLADWTAKRRYAELRERRAGRPLWLLHDGPPYSNNHIHMGTAANKIWKDAAVRQASLAERFSTALNVEQAAVPVAAKAPCATVAPGRGFKVLLAEDNPVNALLTRELLRRRGHRVREVTTGDAAVAAMNEERFDLVLTDIHMPGMDGIEATRAIRADEVASGRVRTPIIALTADALETGKWACKEAGMDGFLTKPVDPALLDQMFRNFFPAGADSAAA